MAGDVAAGARGRAAGQAQPAPELERAVALDVEQRPARAPRDGRRAARVQPAEGLADRTSVAVDADGDLGLRRAAHRDHAPAQRRIGREQLAGRHQQGAPPGLGVLLRPRALHLQRHRLEGPGPHAAVQRHQRALAARGAQVDRQHQAALGTIRGHQNLRATDTTSLLLSCRRMRSPSMTMNSSRARVRVASHSALHWKPQRVWVTPTE